MTPIRRIEWKEIEALAEGIRIKLRELPSPNHKGEWRVYGVPRGGCTIAAMVGVPVDTPNEADVIVDDLIDSGRTRDRFREDFPKLPFIALLDKHDPPYNGQWVEFPWEQGEAPAEDAVARIIEAIGEDPERAGLRDTPDRVMRAWYELTEGYGRDPKRTLSTVFEEMCDEMVVVRNIPFWSTCEHHMLPFTGTATVGYVPGPTADGLHRVVGLSKISRLVDLFARRLQIQERLTSQIALAIEDHLEPLGVGVLIESRHTCQEMRGAQVAAPMVTSCLRGAMREQPEARAEFLALARAIGS